MSDFRTTLAQSSTDFGEVERLCWEYRDFLVGLPEPDRTAVTNAYSVEAYKTVMADLPRLHSSPNGGARLIWKGDVAVGCGMFHPFAPGIAEIKRVYLTKVARGTGQGRVLMEALIADCQRAGHRKIYMDTGRLFHDAIALYSRLGFALRAPYHDAPPEIASLLCFFEMDIAP